MTPSEIADTDGLDAREQFMAKVYEKFESRVLPKELENIGLENTQKYGLCDDEMHNKQTFPLLTDELEPMSEAGDHYLGADILLPRGDKMARGHEVAQSHHACGYVRGRAHSNTILNTRMYQVEFLGGKITELISNIIAASMYIQCDADGNEYLLLYLLVNYCKDKKVISLTEQQIFIQGRPVTWKTIADLQLCCQWKDDSTSCEKL